MKPIKFTKADEKRAAKMGWILWHDKIICLPGVRFKSDAEAAAYVVGVVDYWNEQYSRETKVDYLTCRKAVLLCCGGGR